MTNVLIIPKSMVQEGYTPPPLGLLHVAAMDPETVIIDNANKPDLKIEGVLDALKPKVVGVPIYTAGRVESLRVLKVAKERGAVTVAGGPHVSIMSAQLEKHYPFIDYLVIGDGERAWEAITKGEVNLPKKIRMRVENLDTLPLPAWSKLNVARYPARGEGIHRGNDLSKVPRCSIVLGRGCDGSCTFCSTWWVNKGYRRHGREWLRSHLGYLWDVGVRHLVWQDDCLTSDREGVFDLCDLLRKFGFSSFGTTRADHMDDAMAVHMKDAGFYELSFGLESGSPAILKRMHKKCNLDAAFKARDALRKAGITFTALMIHGFPYETEETRRETREFLARLKADKVCGIGHTMILPGTALYVECKRARLIDDDFWLGEEPYYVYRGGLN